MFVIYLFTQQIFFFFFLRLYYVPHTVLGEGDVKKKKNSLKEFILWKNMKGKGIVCLWGGNRITILKY